MMTTDYLIIGAGHAGCVAASAIRAGDSQGSISMLGEEQVTPYQRPALSKAYLAGAADRQSLSVCQADSLAEQGIEFLCARRAVEIHPQSRQVCLEDGAIIEYQRLLIASGSRVRRLQVPGSGLNRVHYLRTVEDSDALRGTLQQARHLVIVGAGFVGLEVAATAREAFGCQVTVIEAGPGILQRAAPERLREMLQQLHESHGVVFRFNAGVERFSGDGVVQAVHLKGGERLAADAVLVCVGAKPNVELASQAGIEVAAGILTDAQGCTSVPGIYAAGEVAEHINLFSGMPSRYESWQMAQIQAEQVGASMSGVEKAIRYVPWFWTDQYGHNFQMLGCTSDAEIIEVRRNYDEWQSTVIYMAGTRVVGALCVDSGRDIAPLRKAMEKGWTSSASRLADTKIKLKAAFADA